MRNRPREDACEKATEFTIKMIDMDMRGVAMSRHSSPRGPAPDRNTTVLSALQWCAGSM